jgi:hypothetical protein
MGPCAACGQLTEPDVDFCPACAGYAAPATIYSYAPSRLSRSDGSLEQVLAPLPRTRPPAQDELPAAISGGRQAPPEPGPDLAARLRPSARHRKEGRWLVLSALLIVLIIAAGTVLLELGHPGSASTPRPKAAASTSAPAVSSTPATTPSGPQVSVAPPAASAPDEPVVLSFLASYFTAINNHDFAAYLQLFSAPLRAQLSAATFSAGYGTTTDSAIRLTSIGVIGSGELVAQVSFVSHQQPSASPTDSACTAWVIGIYLLPGGGSYQLQQPPAGYQPSYSVCS